MTKYVLIVLISHWPINTGTSVPHTLSVTPGLDKATCERVAIAAQQRWADRYRKVDTMCIGEGEQ